MQLASNSSSTPTGYPVRKKQTSPLEWSGYADDTVMFFEDEKSLQLALDILQSVFQRFALKINVGKTVTMQLNHTPLSPETAYPTSLCQLDGTPVANDRSFKLLGAMLHEAQAATGDLEIETRKESARCKFKQLDKLLLNQHIHLSTRLLFLDGYVRSRLLYGCQNWSLTKRQSDSLDACYRHFLRKMLRNGYRKKPALAADQPSNQLALTNVAVMRICKRTDVSDFIKDQQASFLGHLARYPPTSIAKQLLYNADHYHKSGNRSQTLEEQVLKAKNIGSFAFHRLANKRRAGRSPGNLP